MPITIAELGSFHVGGRQATLSGLSQREIRLTPASPTIAIDPNGEFEVEQMYVQYVRLADPRARYPLLMWHGGGMTGVTWETKPDGGPGWKSRFLEFGHNVYVSDAVERGRASWARFPEIFPAEPFFRSKREAWELFRIGPTYGDGLDRRVAYPNTQFPVEAFDQFAKQIVPRWTGNERCTQAAYNALLRRVGPCVLIAHSQGGFFALRSATALPDLVKAIILIEPGGAPNPEEESISSMRDIPILCVWGDNIDEGHITSEFRRTARLFFEAHQSHGGIIATLNLPNEGIRGNSHMLMMDRNSDLIAARVQAWIKSCGLAD